jgi:hypothetical protein
LVIVNDLILCGNVVKATPSALPVSQPCGFALFHIGERFLGREKFTTFELTESAIDFSATSSLWSREPGIFAAQHLQRLSMTSSGR